MLAAQGCLMKNIPDDHRVARLCGRQKQVRDEAGKVIGVNPQFFELRPKKNEDYLSCDWVDFFSGSEDKKLAGVRKALKSRMPGGGKEARIAVMGVSLLKECGIKRDHKIRVLQKKNSSSYSGISGLPLDNSDMVLLQTMSDEAIVSLVSFL